MASRYISIKNAGFESDNYPVPNNTYYYGAPILSDWTDYDPNSIMDDSVGVENPTGGTTFVSNKAAEGNQYGYIIKIEEKKDSDGEIGIVQTLSENVAADTTYTLSVAVGNPASNRYSSESTDDDAKFTDMTGFPGYRIDLLAGDNILAQDDNSLVIDDGYWKTSTVSVRINSTNEHIGQQLGVRLVNLNDHEDDSKYNVVCFDDVKLRADIPTNSPTNVPTKVPTKSPSLIPTLPPTQNPMTPSPTLYIVHNPTTSKINPSSGEAIVQTMYVTENSNVGKTQGNNNMSVSAEVALISVCVALLLCGIGLFICYWLRKERVYKRLSTDRQRSEFLANPLLDEYDEFETGDNKVQMHIFDNGQTDRLHTNCSTLAPGTNSTKQLIKGESFHAINDGSESENDNDLELGDITSSYSAVKRMEGDGKIAHDVDTEVVNDINRQHTKGIDDDIVVPTEDDNAFELNAKISLLPNKSGSDQDSDDNDTNQQTQGFIE